MPTYSLSLLSFRSWGTIRSLQQWPSEIVRGQNDLQALLGGLDFLLARVVLVYPNLVITVTVAHFTLDATYSAMHDVMLSVLNNNVTRPHLLHR